MKVKMNRFLSLLLTVVLAVGMVPMDTYAAEDNGNVQELRCETEGCELMAGHDGECTGQAEFERERTIVVAKIGENPYERFSDVLAAASAMTGDVTVEIYDKVTLNSNLSGNYDSIKFVGKDTDAEIYLDVQGYITAAGKKVAFEELTLSKSAGGFITNAGFMNVAFGVYDVNEVTYTDCTFVNGAYASAGEVTFTGCTFKHSHDKYGLWAYGNVDVKVDECRFADYRGIKMYAEGAAKTVDLTVENTDFTAVTDKPAIVLTYGESVTLANNIYSSTGTFELDLDGAPNGTAVTSDVAPTCKNDNGACGVLVDGKIYTTVAQAAEAATSGSTVTLLHNSAERVELAEGVTLEKNGHTADGVTVAAPALTEGDAQIGGVLYATLQDAVDAAYETGGEVTITLLKDVTENVTINEKVGLYLIIDGADKTMGGKMTINPLSDTNDNRRITIQNISFVNIADTGVDFITANQTNHYPRLSVLNCDFTGNGKDTDVAIRTKSAYDLIIKDCTGTGLHSFLQNTAGVKVTVRNVTVTDSKGGLAMGTAQNVEVRGCNLTTRTYGIRLDAVLDTSATLNGNVVNAYIPVSVRKATAADYKVSLTGSASSYTASNADGKWMAICGTEYEENVALNPATGNVKLTWNTDVLDESGVYGAYEWPIIAVYSDGYTKGFDSLKSAMNFGYSGGEQTEIVVREDITESMDELIGNIVTDNPDGVTIKNTIVDAWIYCSENFTIGEGVTYDATGYDSGLFMYAENAVINGAVLTDCYYQRYADTKLTINEPGSMTVKTETFILRYTDGDGEAGIYVVGDNDDTTVGLDASVIYFYQGCINAKDADLKVGTYWQTNGTDGTGSANLILDNSNMTVTVNEHNMKATGNSTVTLTNGSKVAVAGNYEGVAVSADETSAISKNGETVFDAKVGEMYYATLQAAIDAVQDGETITLLRDVNVTEAAYGQNALNYVKAVDCTIDLGGYKLSADTGNSVFRFNITDSGATSDVTVTIKNGTVVSGSNTWCALMAAGISTDVKAVMNLENLTVEASKGYDFAVKAWENGHINAKNVTVNATNCAGGFYAVGGEIVLDECTVNQQGLYSAPYTSMAFAVSDKGTMTINSGKYSAEPTAETEGNGQGTSHGSWVGGVMSSGGTLIINGGTFENGNYGEDSLATAARGLIVADTGAKVEIHGGGFNALKNVFDIQNNLGNAEKNPEVMISGGYFSENPMTSANSNLIHFAEGKACVEGTYTYEGNIYGCAVVEEATVVSNVDIKVKGNEASASGTFTEAGKAKAIAKSVAVDEYALLASVDALRDELAANEETAKKAKEALKAAGIEITDTTVVTTLVKPYMKIVVKELNEDAVSEIGKTVIGFEINMLYDVVATTDPANMITNSNEAGYNTVIISKGNAVTSPEAADISFEILADLIDASTDLTAKERVLYVEHLKADGSVYNHDADLEEGTNKDMVSFHNDRGYSTFNLKIAENEVPADKPFQPTGGGSGTSHKNHASENENEKDHPVEVYYADSNKASAGAKTGDSTNVFGYVSIIVLTGIALTILYFKKRRA